ncbi:MAG: [protein-PII] uridylyltransferase [bacterium]
MEEIYEKLNIELQPFLGNMNSSNKNAVVKDYISVLRNKLKEFHNSGLGGYDFAVIMSDYIDLLLERLFALSVSERDTTSALVAIGGYGRGELNAYSDIDLLFLYKDTLSEGFQNNMLYPLWDTRLDVGHSSRTVDECIEDAKEDYTFLTSLMDQRFIAGNFNLFDELHNKFCNMVRSSAEKFFNEREQELYARRMKYSTPVYTLEPNIKEGPGGLRDVHNMLWLTRLFIDIADITEFKRSPFFDADMYEQFIKNYNILMRLRNEMHFLSGSKNDRLTLEVQKHLSIFSGYENDEDILGVEKFLGNFFETTHQIAELVDDYIRYLKETYIIPKTTETTSYIGEYYAVKQKQLSLKDTYQDLFSNKPEELINVFKILINNELKPTIALKNTIKKEIAKLQEHGHIDILFPAFLTLFEEKNLSRLLFLMNDYGILGSIITEFKQIANRIQYDMYHIYTVGIHSIKTVEEIEKIRDGDKDGFLKSLYNQVKNKTVLLLAALLHDIGKGHGKDHARKGSEIAYNIATRLGLQQTDAELVSFLVRNHLILSDTAQRRDINDEKLIYEFAKLIKRRENLKMLYILTVADLRAVSLNVWTEWKGELINELYKRTEEALEQGLDMARLTTEKYQIVRQQVKEELKHIAEESIIEEFLDGFKPRYFTTYSIQEILEHFNLINQFKSDGLLAVTWSVQQQFGYTKLNVCTTDRPGIFSIIAGVLSSTGANIMDANISIRKDGIIIDVFRVEDADKLHPYPEYKLQKFISDLRGCLSGNVTVESLLSARFKPSILKEKVLNKQPTEIIINDDVSDIYTLIEIYTQDRQKLLYDITSTISKFGLNIVVAKITTRVDQVADIFYVEKIGGGKPTSSQNIEELVSALKVVIDKGSDIQIDEHR